MDHIWKLFQTGSLNPNLQSFTCVVLPFIRCFPWLLRHWPESGERSVAVRSGYSAGWSTATFLKQKHDPAIFKAFLRNWRAKNNTLLRAWDSDLPHGAQAFFAPTVYVKFKVFWAQCCSKRTFWHWRETRNLEADNNIDNSCFRWLDGILETVFLFIRLASSKQVASRGWSFVQDEETSSFGGPSVWVHSLAISQRGFTETFGDDFPAGCILVVSC